MERWWELLKEGFSQRSIANRFQVTQMTIQRIAHGVTWKHC